MEDNGYVFIGTALVVIPLLSLWKRRWWSFALYAIGSLIYLYEVLRAKDGWDSLADLATLMVVVIPIYVVATTLWIVGLSLERKNKKRLTK